MAKSKDHKQIASCTFTQDTPFRRIDIPLKKLRDAIKAGIEVIVKCHLIEKNYYGTHVWKYNAQKLYSDLEVAKIWDSIKKDGRTNNLVIECTTGFIYKNSERTSRISKPRNRSKRLSMIGSDAIRFAICKEKDYLLDCYDSNKVNMTFLNEWGARYMQRIVARTAIWPTADDFKACDNGVAYPYHRRYKSGEKRNTEEKLVDEITGKEYTVYIDDNQMPQRMMRGVLKDRYNRSYEGYHVCHIWPDTCHDRLCFTNYANVVLLPNALASLSDYGDDTIEILMRKSYEKFTWRPDKLECPKKLTIKLPWLELPRMDQADK